MFKNNRSVTKRRT